MRVLLVGPYPPPFGGVAVHVMRLDAGLRDQGIATDILTRSTMKSDARDRTIVGSRWALIQRMGRFAADHDIVHDHTEFYQCSNIALSFLYARVARRSASRKILTIHDGTFPERWKHSDILRQQAVRRLLRSYDEIIVISETLSAFVHSLGIRDQQCHIIRSFLPLPAPVRSLENDLESFFRRFRRVIVMIGALHAVYHPEVVLRAFTILRSTMHDVGLLIVAGSFVGPSRQSKYAEGLPAEVLSHVHIVHDLALEVTQTVIRRSSVLIRSAWPDGDGMSMREAMMWGTPVVASETGERPVGVLTYTPGDAEDLARKVGEAMEMGRDEAGARRMRAEAVANLEGIVGLYRREPSASTAVSQ